MLFKRVRSNTHILPEKLYATGTKIHGKSICNVAGVASVLILLFLFMLALTPTTALACGGCSEDHYPWMHNFPTDEELNAATTKFKQEYVSQINEDFTITEMWYLKMERPGNEEQDGTIDVILGFKEELNEAGVLTSKYHYTSISYAEDEGFFFWPYTMGSFDSREKLDGYIEEYIVGNPQSKQVVSPVVPVNLNSLQQSSGISGIFVLQALLAAFGMIFVTLTIRKKMKKE